MYPQEFVIELGTTVTISRIKLATHHVQEIQIDRANATDRDWEPVFRTPLSESAEGHLQMESNQVNKVKAQRLRVRINAGYAEFCSVHNVSIEGRMG